MVVSRNVDVGQTVASSLQAPTLFVIANDLTKIQVQTSVPEADIGKLEDGQSIYTCCCNAGGTVLDDLIVYRLGSDRWLLVVNASRVDEDVAHLREHLPQADFFTDKPVPGSRNFPPPGLPGASAGDAFR